MARGTLASSFVSYLLGITEINPLIPHYICSKCKYIEFAKDEIAKIDIIDKEDVIDACRLNIKKAYPAYFGSYEQFDQVKADLKSIDNLYCVGRNGQHRYNNMDHSMVTALIAASLVLEENKYTVEDLWNVNVEKEYHEKKETK